MARAQVKLYKHRTGRRDKELVMTRIIHEANRKATVGWIRSLIQRRFPEFVMGGRLILLSKNWSGYAAMRALVPKPPENFAWMYLEITPLKEEEPQVRHTPFGPMAPSGTTL